MNGCKYVSTKIPFFFHFQILNDFKAFGSIVGTFTKSAISGDGDRQCAFRTNLVPCELLEFGTLRTAEQFVAKLNDLSEVLFVKCGKDALKKSVAGPLKSCVL